MAKHKRKKGVSTANRYWALGVVFDYEEGRVNPAGEPCARVYQRCGCTRVQISVEERREILPLPWIWEIKIWVLMDAETALQYPADPDEIQHNRASGTDDSKRFLELSVKTPITFAELDPLTSEAVTAHLTKYPKHIKWGWLATIRG